jgi:DNA-binding beta-propeller fold protein YncE
MISTFRNTIAVTVAATVCLLLAGTVRAAGNIVYTASNTIVVVDVDRGEVLKEIPLEHFITDIVFSDSGERAYVAASNGVTVLDARTHEITAHLTDLPAKTLELSPDNAFLYVMDHPVVRKEDGTQEGGAYQIEAVDLSTGKVVHTEVLGQDYYDFFLAADGRTIYTLQFGVNRIDVIDTEKWEKTRTITVETDAPLWKSIGSRRGGELYIPEYSPKGNLWVLNTRNDQSRRVVLDERLKLRGIARSEQTGRLYILSLGRLLVVDPAAGTVVQKLELDIPYSAVDVSHDGKQIYLTNPVYQSGGSVSVLDAENLEIVRVIDLPTISPFTVGARP